jgi:hypothetical protein
MPVSKVTVKQSAKAPAPKKARKVTLDDVLNTIDQIGKALKETQEAHKETEKTLNKVIGDLGNKLGNMAEYTLVPNLPDKMQAYGFSFTKISRNIKMNDYIQDIHAEIDVLLENGKQAMVVEVKVTLRPEDVKDHSERMEKIRRYADLHGDQRELYGALAGTVVDETIKKHALRQGFYVIEPSGEDVLVTKPISRPKVW